MLFTFYDAAYCVQHNSQVAAVKHKCRVQARSRYPTRLIDSRDFTAFCGGRRASLIPNSARLRESVLRCILRDRAVRHLLPLFSRLRDVRPSKLESNGKGVEKGRTPMGG